MRKLKMLQPRVKVLDPWKERGLKMAPTPRKANSTGRDADPRRTIPLNSSQWRKLRDLVLARDPICQECYKRGHIQPSTDADHVSGDPSDNSMRNLQGLCHSCHSRKTRREMNGQSDVWGCDVGGMPLDPDHPWNDGKSLAADGDRPRPQSSSNPKSESQP